MNNRQADIVAYLKEHQRCSVRKLAAHFYVSEMTVRRDLKKLEEQGCIQRYNGGAVYLGEYESLPIDSRRLLHAIEKRTISEKARKYLGDSMTVFIDSSSTSLYIVPLLVDYQGITIVTNSVQCLIAASKYHLRCIMAGGMYYEHDMCTVGGMTDEFLRGINVDIGFFSARGLADDGTISDSDEYQTAARKAVMPNCEKRVFLFDSTKQHKKYLYTLCSVDEADDVILV